MDGLHIRTPWRGEWTNKRFTGDDRRQTGEGAAPRGKRPKGAHGAEVYVAVIPPRTAPPADINSYKFVRTVTRGSAEVTFPFEQGGQSAPYLVRWVSATGEPGPWSKTVTATVAA